MALDGAPRVDQNPTVPTAEERTSNNSLADRLGGVIGDREKCVRLILETSLAELGITTRVQLQGSANPDVLE